MNEARGGAFTSSPRSEADARIVLFADLPAILLSRGALLVGPNR